MAAGSKPACGAKKRQQEEDGTVTYCTLSAGWGTDHLGTGRCKFHGGNTKTQRAGARKVQADQEVRAMLAQLDVQPVDDPLTALSLAAGQIVAWQQAVAATVNRLGEDGIRYEGAAGAEQLRAEVGMYERAMDRVEKVLSGIARLDIDARLARIEEEKARIIMEAVQAGLAAIHVSEEDSATVKRVMARHLRAVQ